MGNLNTSVNSLTNNKPCVNEYEDKGNSLNNDLKVSLTIYFKFKYRLKDSRTPNYHISCKIIIDVK